MFTVCPKCTLTLVVTTVDLRAGQGYVRCGRCANVFNALIALREGDPNGSISDTANRRLQETAPKPPVNPALGSGVAMEPEPEPAPEPEPEPQPEPEPEPESIADTESMEPSLEFDASSTDVSEIFISPPEAEHDTGSGSFETVVLGEDDAPAPELEPQADEPADDPTHTDTIAADEWSLLDDEPAADDESVIEESPLALDANTQPATDGGQQPDPPWVEEMFAEAEAEAERVRTAEREALQVMEPEEEPEAPETGVESLQNEVALEPLLAAPKPHGPRWVYVAGIAVLTLLLLGQLVHFNRQKLVVSDTFGPLISKVYGWFDVVLTPRSDLMAYAVTQYGADAEGSDRLRVRISVQNTSQRKQPLPLLRLTLQDRFGNAVATRDIEPREYLKPAAAGLRELQPDQRIDAEVQVVDPGKAAFGFEVDACLRAESGSIGCANDARRRAPG